jgi:hypothetical protein
MMHMTRAGTSAKLHSAPKARRRFVYTICSAWSVSFGAHGCGCVEIYNTGSVLTHASTIKCRGSVANAQVVPWRPTPRQTLNACLGSDLK